MSVLIKNIEMPKNCWECPCFDDFAHICNLDNECRDVHENRPDWCPLVEINKSSGKWIYEEINYYTTRIICSCCGSPAPFICVSDDHYGYQMHGVTMKTNFCPNCGADMRG